MHEVKQRLVDIVRIKGLLLALSLIISSYGITFSQDSETQEVYKSRLKMEFFKKADDSKLIRATISARIDRKPVPIKNVALNFYDVSDSAQFIEMATTNAKGIAEITLPIDYVIGRDTLKSAFKVEFAGNDKFKASSKEIGIQDAILNVSYDIIDSVYTISVAAHELVNGVPRTPLSDMDVYVYVQRMFSLLKVGEGWLQDGEAIIEIPNDLPGDENNDLIFVIKIPETENYGTIENMATVKWGQEDTWIEKRAKIKDRALWEPMAPLWMVITLSILIFGVFYHYGWIIYKLFKIKSLGKKESFETND